MALPLAVAAVAVAVVPLAVVPVVRPFELGKKLQCAALCSWVLSPFLQALRVPELHLTRTGNSTLATPAPPEHAQPRPFRP